MAILRLDNNNVAQTSWKQCSQQAWDQRFTVQLDKVIKYFQLIFLQNKILNFISNLFNNRLY